MGNFNFEEYRQPWETGPHWELKREFLERYQDHFHVDRLLCLAQAYSNIELLHCSYPLEVMQEIRQLSQPLQGCKRFRNISVEQKNETLKGKRKSNDFETPQKYKFVKFCSSNDPSVMDTEQSNNVSKINVGVSVDHTSIAQSPDLEIIQTLANKVKMQLPIKRKQSFDLFESSVQSLDMQNVFHMNFKYINETNSNSASNKNYYCEFYIGNTLLSVGDGFNKENAKRRAARFALHFLGNFESLPAKNIKQDQKEVCKIETKNIGSLSKLEKTQCNQMKKTPQKIFSKPKRSEVLQENKQVPPELAFQMNFAKKLRSIKEISKQSALSLINETSKRLNVSDVLVFTILEDRNSPIHNRIYLCDLSLKNISIARGKGTSKKRAKNQTAEIAFQYFMKLLEQNKNKCSNSGNHKIKQTFIEETDKGESQIYNPNSIISKTESEINFSLETNNLNNEILSSFNIANDVSDGKQVIPLKDAAQELSANRFAINEKLLANSYKQQFLLFDQTLIAKDHQQSPGGILNFSVSKCRKQLSFNIEEIQPNGTIKADVIIDKNVIATGIGSSKAEAKLEATQSALEKLRKEVYTVKVKKSDEDGFIISYESIFDSINQNSQAVSEDNIGCKMLKKMGWTGGGIGKIEGIVEPIEANDHSFGKGLGYSKQGKPSKLEKINIPGFKLKIETLLLDYSESKETQPLIFSSDFCKAERKEIHTIARKYNLISNSYGQDESRQLHIKRKLTITELLNSILQAGGSTDKYELVDLST